MDESQTGIKTAGRNINNLIYVDDTTLMAKGGEELSLLKVKEERKNLAENSTSKMKIIASCLITSWQINGETMEAVTVFIFLCSKVNEVGDFRDKIKRCLLLGGKAMTNLDTILKSRDFFSLFKKI